jgi:Tol biopolymer transport system component
VTRRMHLLLVLYGAMSMTLTILCLPPAMVQAQSATSTKENSQGTPVPRGSTHLVVVKPGDSLWSISQEQLGQTATLPRIDSYVGRLYALNRDQIGADPNLIFPGQRFSLPPLGEGRDSGQQQSRQSERSASGMSTQSTENIKLGADLNEHIVFQSDSPEIIWAINAHGSTPSRLTLVRLSANPSLSPNGKKIVFTAERTEGGCTGSASASASGSGSARECRPEVNYAQLYVRNIDGSGKTMLLEEKSAMLSGPTWSPDSKEIAFASSGANTYSRRCTIYSMNADGAGNRSTLAEIERCWGIHSSAWSPDGKHIALGVQRGGGGRQADIWVVNVSGGTGENNQPRQLAHFPVNEGGVIRSNVSPTWSPDGTQIAFTRTTGYVEGTASDSHIYKINADGSGRTRLTRDPAHYGNPTDAPIDPAHAYSPMYSPAWSPDGEKIAFVRGYLLNYAAAQPISSAIYVMGSDGSNPALIRDFPQEYVQNLDWLPDYVDLPLGASTTDATDQKQAEKAISEKPVHPTEDCKPVEESSGEIALQANGDIWTMNADGSDPTRLAHSHLIEDTPAWSPDGKKIAFVKEVKEEVVVGSLPDETETRLVKKVVVMDANGCKQIELPVPKGKYAYEPSWSADGEKIAFWYPAEGGIYVTNADGKGMPKRLTTPGLPGSEARPEWSPDGTQIAFQSKGQGDWDDIYVMDVSPEGNTSRPQRLTGDDLQEATEPSWSPDGTEIAFSSLGDIYKLDVNSLKETRLTNNQDHEHDPTWSPDGERIAFVSDGSATSSSGIYVMRSDGSDLSLVRDFPIGHGEMEDGGYTIRPDWRPLP